MKTSTLSSASLILSLTFATNHPRWSDRPDGAVVFHLNESSEPFASEKIIVPKEMAMHTSCWELARQDFELRGFTSLQMKMFEYDGRDVITEMENAIADRNLTAIRETSEILAQLLQDRLHLSDPITYSLDEIRDATAQTEGLMEGTARAYGKIRPLHRDGTTESVVAVWWPTQPKTTTAAKIVPRQLVVVPSSGSCTDHLDAMKHEANKSRRACEQIKCRKEMIPDEDFFVSPSRMDAVTIFNAGKCFHTGAMPAYVLNDADKHAKKSEARSYTYSDSVDIHFGEKPACIQQNKRQRTE